MSTLPSHHTAWLTHVLDGPVPPETHATCDHCAMCTDLTDGADGFNPQTKCCTYLPFLPNFLAGAALDEPLAGPGRESVRARIAAGVAVTPLGLGVPASHALIYAHQAPGFFGRALSMRCPHYVEDGGRCGIWRHRNAVCATWFCKHDRGAIGWSFWDSLRELLSAIEGELARACLLELDLDPSAIARALPGTPWPGMDRLAVGASELDGRPEPAAGAAAWGAWAQREIEFYRACAKFVAGLEPDDVLGRCGQDVQLRIRTVRAAWRRLRRSTPPSRPRAGPVLVVRSGPETCRVGTYSLLDPLEMPRALFDVLHEFDGRPQREVRAAVARQGGPRLTGGVVRKLADFRILVDPEDHS